MYVNMDKLLVDVSNLYECSCSKGSDKIQLT